jgi:hypothetical protein
MNYIDSEIKKILCPLIVFFVTSISSTIHPINHPLNNFHLYVLSNSGIKNQTQSYKQFSILAQPTPIGRASSTNYKNNAGFLHPLNQKHIHPNTHVLIIAGGGMEQNRLWPTTQYLANRFYRILIRRFFNHAQIMYISDHSYNYDDDGDDIDEIIVDDHDPSTTDIQSYIESLYLNLETPIVNEKSRLIIYFTDHGGPGRIQLGKGVYLEASEFDTWLDKLQASTNCQVAVIIEACYSGTFITPLTPDSNQRRVLISSSNTNVSLDDETGAVSFSNFLFNGIFCGDNLKKSFYDACKKLKHYVLFTYQTPLLIDGQNETYADNFYIAGSFRKKDAFPEILETTAQTNINSGEFTLFARATDLEGQIKVWANVIKPDIVIPQTTSDFVTPIIASEKIPLNQTNEQYLFQGTYDFQCNGRYLITFFAKDQMGDIVSKEVAIDVSNGIDCMADINNDFSIDLSDVIILLNLCSQITDSYTQTVSGSDVNHDGYLGLEEVIYVMQKVLNVKE